MFINYDAIQLAPSYDGSGFQSSTSTKSDSTPIISCPRDYSFCMENAMYLNGLPAL
jgi:hypothetical protein